MEHEEFETREEGDSITSVDPMSVDFNDVIDCGDDNTFFLQGKICPAFCRCRRCDTCPPYCRCRRLVMKKNTKKQKNKFSRRGRRGFITK